MNRCIAFAALACLALLGPTSARSAELLPYQAQGWRYQQVTSGDPLEGTFMQPSFDDYGWATGQAAFGNANIGCPVQTTDHTNWDINTVILLRHTFVADPASAVTIYFAIDNDASLWINGVLVASVVHDGCPNLDDYTLSVPPGVVQLGANLVAVRASDRGGVNFFDLRI